MTEESDTTRDPGTPAGPGSAGNVADLVRRAAARAPHRAALVTPTRTVSWSELDALVDRVGAGLQGKGLHRGDRVAILLPNSIDFAAAYFGALRAGLVAVPLNTAYTSSEIDYQLTDADVGLVVTDESLAGCVADRPTVLVDGAEWAAIAGPSGAAPPAVAAAEAPTADAPGGDELAVLLYTSGTTGRPKGAMLSHRALLANLDQLARIEPSVVAPDDVVLLVLPLFHVYGLNAGLGMTARAAATGVLANRFDPVETLALVRDQKVTNVIGAPPMYVAWSMLPGLDGVFRGLRLAVSGAAPLPAAVMAQLEEATGTVIYEGYGLTETAPVLTTTLCSPQPKPGSIGRPIPGVELRLLDDSGREVDEDDPGEIVVRGDNVFSGYWPDGSGGADAEGWFRTGDVAYADPDGDLFLVDRVRELILVSGFNVYPREVEDVIATHPAVAEVAVVAVPHPYTGEAVRALVVPRPGAQLSADDVIAHAAARLARFKCPTSVEFVDELPHSATGKVAKGRLREG
ncbi:MAG TPA: AMP-binding protein [Mycobacteriales bacterium]|nr:AMP-binding protein [Mycobacteriales bacterium]